LKILKNLKNINNSLKPGCKIYIGDLETEEGSFHANPDISIKHFGFDKNEFAEMMKKANFKNVRSKQFSKLKNRKENIRFF